MGIGITVAHGTDLDKLIKTSIENRLTELVEQEIEAAKQRVEQRMRSELGNIALGLLSYYSVHKHGVDLTIHVRNEQPKV